MDSPKLPYSNSTSSSTPFGPSAGKSHRLKLPSRGWFLIIVAVSCILLLLLSLLLYSTISKSSKKRHENKPHLSPQPNPPPTSSSPPPIAQIRLACNATRFPDPCFSSLSKPGTVPPDPKPSEIITSAISVSFQNQYDCWAGLHKVNDTKQVIDTITFLDNLVKLSSNALNMMVSFDNFGDDVDSWIPPATERDGFWEKGKPDLGSGTDPTESNLGFPSGLTEDVTVCKNGGCSYKTVQEAVNAAPETNGTVKFVIRIKEGIYEETVRVSFERKNVVFIGDGMGKTVITGSLNIGMPGMTTYNTATVGVLGDGFMARDLTIENTAGSDAQQAVAFRSDSDFSVLENCELLGNQDTLYAHSLRQFYKNCRILGNVDFIFGNSASVFQNCEILITPRQSDPAQGANNAITAHGRIDPSQSTGFVFLNCSINGTEEYLKQFQANPKVHNNYLGRPWKEYSRTLFVGCDFDALISPDGWMPWSGDFALKTLYYGEYKNTGPGSVTTKRVPWSSQIPEKNVHVYSVANFIQADEWTSISA